MRAKIKIAVTIAMAVALTLAIVPTRAAAEPSYTAPYSTVRVGLYGSDSTKSYPWANLQNVSGKGYGYDLGYFNTNREFVSLGASITDTDEVSVLMDRNMVYDSLNNSYSEGTGNVTVGCAHLLLDGSYNSYASAKAAVSQYSDGFVRYQNGVFLALVGNFSTRAAAEKRAESVQERCTVDVGTDHTVTVVQTGTNRILFEFDCDTSINLALRPIGPKGGEAQTWHRGYMYRGSFVFLRNTGKEITTVNYVNIEDYVKGVVCHEMDPSWPLEALKAQAISARTYAMYNLSKHRALGYDLCNTVDCQAYHGINGSTANSDRAVDETRGQYLMYNGKLCESAYAASNGGASEDSENVWGSKVDYLRGVMDPYEKDIANSVSGYYWVRTYTPYSLGAKLRAIGYDSSDVIRVDLTFTKMGNVLSVTFTDVNDVKFTFRREKARTALGFNSQRYTVNGLGPAGDGTLFVNEGSALSDGLNGAYAVGGSGNVEGLPSGDVYAISGTGQIGKLNTEAGSTTGSVGVNSAGNFVFSGSGDGHNVGMSQWGAYSMAKNYNKTCEEILKFYYTGAQVVTSKG